MAIPIVLHSKGYEFVVRNDRNCRTKTVVLVLSEAYFAEKQLRNYVVEARKQHFKGVKFF